MNDTTSTADAKLVWTPGKEAIANSNIMDFIARVNARHGLSLNDFSSLYDWSVSDSPAFWDSLWDYAGVIGEKGDALFEDAPVFADARFFPQARLNFAENLLRRRDDTDAIVFRGEDKVSLRLSWRELYSQVAKFADFLKRTGVQPGDRIAAVMPNIPQTVIGMLAATSLGCVWSSCAAEFGEQGVLDRFEQIGPTVLLVCDGYYFNGKRVDFLAKARNIIPQLPTLKSVVLVAYAGQSDLPGATLWDEALDNDASEITFVPVAFDAHLYILFSSGTTGKPKCIVHSVGGALLQHLKEHRLHCDVKAGDRFFYFTTCSWMMWNWLVSGLASEATLMLYDGSPFYPSGNVLFDYAAEEKFTFFGVSAKYIDAVKKHGLLPKSTHDLSSIRMITSTGSPLLPDSYDFVYEGISDDACLASISGGTDILSCFVLGNPTGPVYRGEIQARGLGMAVEVWNDEGKPVVGEKGELVCVKPFPSKPACFWNDPDGARYHAAYFERFDNVWAHGDFAELTPRGGMIIYGRSDAILNPGGVRIGTAEIYREVEKLDEVIESIAVGQEIEGDVRVVLFVVLRDGVTLDDDLQQRIRKQVRSGASPRHVPAVIAQVPEIPRTTSGKIVELAVRDVIHGREVKNVNALANPKALEHFRDRDEVRLS
ncbi:acetoacetate--CoA ligase [Granulosicoccaceae sp. 1_MG-2023]|nr:acetoacetate--CoA ligase [Granulosicoccaceae sp. 1_MG-2023]